MTQREKLLVGIVGTVVAILLNLFLISFFLKNQRQLRSALEVKKSELAAMKQLLADRDLWAKRDAEIRAAQPKIDNQSTAGGRLLEEVIRKVAREHDVLLKDPSIGTPERRPYCIAVPVTISTTSTWKGLIDFMRALQGKDKFVVIESATFRKDTSDQTKMDAKFRIAKWYAPEP